MDLGGATAGEHEPGTPAAPAAPRERLLTWPLGVFLAFVATVTAVGLWHKYPRPGAAAAIELLGDGDLDAAERTRVLARLVAGARTSADTTERWGGLVAAVLVGDRDAYRELLAVLGDPVPRALPSPPLERWLHLGDPVGDEIAGAWRAEAEGRRGDALRRWQAAATLCELMPRPFAAEVAATARARLEK